MVILKVVIDWSSSTAGSVFPIPLSTLSAVHSTVQGVIVRNGKGSAEFLAIRGNVQQQNHLTAFSC